MPPVETESDVTTARIAREGRKLVDEELGRLAAECAPVNDDWRRAVEDVRDVLGQADVPDDPTAWRAMRVPVAILGARLGIAAGVLAKIATDVGHGNEVRQPVARVRAAASVLTTLEAPHDPQREAEALSDALECTAAAARSVRELLGAR